MRFTADYVERVTLRDGTKVLLRLVAPDDKELLRRSFEQWSPESRYARFFVPKHRLSDSELRYLTEVDQIDHFALGAIREAGDDRGEAIGMAIARFIRLRDITPPTAEAAVAVADEAQGRGLGKLMFERLIEAAAERGIERFRCDVLCSNQAMHDLVARLAPSHRIEVEAGVWTIEFALADTALYDLLRAAAGGALEIRPPRL